MVTPNVFGTELSVEATADSYTNSEYPNVNYGASDSLFCYNYTYELFNETYSYEKHVWLKFDLSEIPSEATVNSIILRMHTSVVGPRATNKVGVFPCSNTDWQEMTITWSNSPNVSGQSIATINVGTWDKDYDFDVISTVEGKKEVTLVLKTLESTELGGYAEFVPRESSWTYLPRLIVDYSTPSQPLTLDPFLGYLAVGLGVAIVIVIISAYTVTRKKKQVPPTTPPTPSSTAPSTPPVPPPTSLQPLFLFNVITNKEF